MFKNKKNILLCLLCIILCIVVSGCGGCNKSDSSGGTSGGDDSTPEENSYELDASTISLALDEEQAVQVLNNDEGLPIEWLSDDVTVATVENGTVKAISVGKTTIKAIIDGETLTCYVNIYIKYENIVEIVLANELKDNGEYSIRLLKGDEYSFEPTLIDGTAVENVEFVMTTEDLALSVSDMTIKALSETQKAKVTISCTYNSVEYSVYVYITVDEEVGA